MACHGDCGDKCRNRGKDTIDVVSDSGVALRCRGELVQGIFDQAIWEVDDDRPR